jgi:aldehyde:ferredoxin oxidoreductase
MDSHQKVLFVDASSACYRISRYPLEMNIRKDYEPYQTMGPLRGIFDQRAAERLNHQADRYGFDAISAGGVLAWLMECLDQDLLAYVILGRRPGTSLF